LPAEFDPIYDITSKVLGRYHHAVKKRMITILAEISTVVSLFFRLLITAYTPYNAIGIPI
jgi:hypothetical protein